MLNKRGFTLIELAITITLISVLVFVLIEITIALRGYYFNSGLKSELITKQALILTKINDDFKNHIITDIEACGVDCYEIFFADSTSKTILIEDEIFRYGNYATDLGENIVIADLNIEYYSFEVGSESNFNAYVKLEFTIEHDYFKEEDFGGLAIYQYNDSLQPINYNF